MEASWAWEEVEKAKLPDGRYRRNLAAICSRLAEQSEVSFSSACGPRLRQSAHRLFEDEKTTPEGLLAGHREQTVQRCASEAWVLIPQDTTSLDYSSHSATTGLGQLGSGRRRGLWLHTALAVSTDGVPLGVLHQAIWARAEGKVEDRRRRTILQKESSKWIEGVKAVEAALPQTQNGVVIQDREGDVFAALSVERRATLHLLVRACQPRKVALTTFDPSTGTTAETVTDLLTAIREAPEVGSQRVTVPRKAGRPERTAVLTLQQIEVEIAPPQHRRAGEPDQPLRYRVVRAFETEPPEGEEGIEWILLTTLKEGEASGARVVEYYSRRWVIERFHYTLKSGGRVERLQIDDAASLQNALALYSLVAWRLLALTYEARSQPDAPPETAFSEVEVTVLRQQTKQPLSTLRDAVRAVARLGGFEGAPSVGEPGVKVLWLGLRRLSAIVEGYQLALSSLQLMIHD